jgi:hypothetical protein
MGFQSHTHNTIATSASLDSEIDRIHQVIQSGQPNFAGCRFPVPTQLNIPVWSHLLSEYHDKQIITFLRFGWPIRFTNPFAAHHAKENHKGVQGYETQLQQYFSKELQHSAILGPFPSNPFRTPIQISPLNTVNKKDSSDRRVILDLSFPSGLSINDGIPDNQYLGQPCDLVYPGVDEFIRLINQVGQGAWMFK